MPFKMSVIGSLPPSVMLSIAKINEFDLRGVHPPKLRIYGLSESGEGEGLLGNFSQIFTFLVMPPLPVIIII